MNQQPRDWQADAIKIAAVATAVPRWTGALLESEGVPIPDDWLTTWRIIAAFLSIGMAVTEALAVNYIFGAWRSQAGRTARILLALIGICLVIFAIVLTPYIAAKVRDITLLEVLGDNWLWWVWSVSVAMSTFFTVGSVGYAQGRRTTIEPTIEPTAKPEALPVAMPTFKEALHLKEAFHLAATSIPCPECQVEIPPEDLAQHLVAAHASDYLQAVELLEQHGVIIPTEEVLEWLRD